MATGAGGAALGNLGNAYANLGEVPKAIERYQQQLQIAREIGDRRGEGAALGNLGNAYADLGEVPKAIEYFEQRLQIAREIGDRRGEGNACWNLGLVYENSGDLQEAVELMEVTLSFERKIGHPDYEKDSADCGRNQEENRAWSVESNSSQGRPSPNISAS